jgi:chaperonin GroES
MTTRPLHDRVVVKRTTATTQTSSGIIIPDNVAEKPDEGVVVSTGPGKRTEAGAVIPLTVKENDKVIFGKMAGTTIKINGEELVILREEEIFAIIGE